MRVPLPNLRPNGHAPVSGRVFAITGMCQEPTYRVRVASAEQGDFCLIHLGASAIGSSANDPYFVLRRVRDDGATAATLRVDWDGIFTILANDDERAEELYEEIIAPAQPEETQRNWSDEAETAQSFLDLLLLA